MNPFYSNQTGFTNNTYPQPCKGCQQQQVNRPFQTFTPGFTMNYNSTSPYIPSNYNPPPFMQDSSYGKPTVLNPSFTAPGFNSNPSSYNSNINPSSYNSYNYPGYPNSYNSYNYPK